MTQFIKSLLNQNLWYWIYTKRIFIVGFIGVVGFGIYIGFLLFGENSLEVLLNNISLKNELLREVNDLQAQNAKLQKDLFELKGLEP
ncbi:hypothetical protein [Helicobacter fennelliae]|uniref:Septum formation initiator n=1 Tax=Helicobacter fennelliae MRY12-0050 TaxID=1325130 RepID=T1D0G0_9HELI|nr:hypothetical protein [Helicobacter fennelliae]GAD19680.1 hypothetical protein HFN_0920 [Helicobacter fennelliae MRY12-0050]STP07277.1 Uncharacterised protein [Helicobacter fennelliae]STQ85139.1 Uncharacterised protein [Helicobacter fennelliae]